MTRPQDLELQGEQNVFQNPHTAVIPMITGPLSAFGSYLVIRELWRHRMATGPMSGMRPPLVRVLLALSFTDFFLSVALGLSTIPTPRQQTHVPFAMGNFQTCEAQAFFLQFSNVSIPFYMVLMAFYYLMIIKRQFTNTSIRKVEIWAHSGIFIVSLASSIFPIPLDLYNNPYHYCWFDAFPFGCEKSKSDVPCERGHGYLLPFAIYTFLPMWPCFIAVGIMLRKVYAAVREQELMVAKRVAGKIPSSDNANSTLVHQENTQNTVHAHSQGLHHQLPAREDVSVSAVPTRTSPVNRSRSRAIAREGMLFILAFVLTNVGRMIVSIHSAIYPDGNRAMFVIALDVMQPLQGFFNAIVLLHTRKLCTPEGKLVQKGFDACWSIVGRAHQYLASFCWGKSSLQRSSEPGDVEREDSTPMTTSFTKKRSAPAADTSTNNNDHFIQEARDWSLHIFGSHESALFNKNYLDDLSSADADDSILEMEKAAISNLNKKKPQSEPAVEATGSTIPLAEREAVPKNQIPLYASGVNNSNSLSPHFIQASPIRYCRAISDLTADCTDGSTFERLVDERFSPCHPLGPLYKSSVAQNEAQEEEERLSEANETRIPPRSNIAVLSSSDERSLPHRPFHDESVCNESGPISGVGTCHPKEKRVLPKLPQAPLLYNDDDST